MSAGFLAIPYKETGFLNIADATDRYLKSNVSKAVCQQSYLPAMLAPPPPPFAGFPARSPRPCPVLRFTGNIFERQASRDAAGELTEAQLIRNNAAERSGNPDEIRAKLLRRACCRFPMLLNAQLPFMTAVRNGGRSGGRTLLLFGCAAWQ